MTRYRIANAMNPRAQRVGRFAVFCATFVPLFCALAIRPPDEPAKPPQTAQNTAQVSVSPPGTYAIGAVIVNGKPFAPGPLPVRVRRGQRVFVTGWALNPRTMDDGESLAVIIDGGRLRPLDGYGQPRPDVATTISDPDAAQSGFRSLVSLLGLRPGPHHLELTLILGPRRRTLIPTTIPLLIES